MSDNTFLRSTGMTATEQWKPRDGGFRSWLVVLGRFISIGIIFGIINSFSVIYVDLLRILKEEKIENAAFKASLVGSLTYGIIFFVSIIGGIFCDRFGLRLTAIIRTLIASLGLLVSSWVTRTIEVLMLTYSVLFGIGVGLFLPPTIVILSLHFNRRLGLVNGLSTVGGSAFAVILPPIIGILLPLISLPGVYRVLALMTFVLLSLGVCTFTVKFVQLKYPDINGNQFIMYLTLGSAVSRFVIGVISDHKKINAIILQQITFVAMGTLILLLSIASSWSALITIVVGIGLFEGSYVPLLGKIATQMCGIEGVAQAVGFVCGCCAIPLAAGPPVAGYLYETTGSYFIPFLVCGCTPAIGGILMTLIHFVPHYNVNARGSDDSIQSSSTQCEENNVTPS